MSILSVTLTEASGSLVWFLVGLGVGYMLGRRRESSGRSFSWEAFFPVAWLIFIVAIIGLSTAQRIWGSGE